VGAPLDIAIFYIVTHMSWSKGTQHMTHREMDNSADKMTGVGVAQAVDRGRFLRRVGLGAAGVALGAALPEMLASRVTLVDASGGTLNVAYAGNLTNKNAFLSVINAFGKQNGLTVKYNPEPQVFGDTVSKFTTYLSSGYTGIDVYYIDELMAATFSTAGWLEPLEGQVSKANLSVIGPGPIKLSTYNGHLYRVPGYSGAVVFFYRKDLFDKAGLEAPTTWNGLVSAGKKLTKGGVYGLGFAGKNGNSELWNEACYWMGQAGADPFHLKTSAARTTLKFIYDMLHTYKIMPPDTVSADYTTLQNEFIDGRLAMWPVWAGFYAQFEASPSFTKKYKAAVALPPKGPANNTTLADSWGWSVSKYSQNKGMAVKFIDYVTSQGPEVAIAQAEGTLPANLKALDDARTQQAISYAKFVSLYNQQHLTRPRPIQAQVQRLTDAFESPINQYLNNQLSLDAAISQAQSKIDQIQQNS